MEIGAIAQQALQVQSKRPENVPENSAKTQAPENGQAAALSKAEIPESGSAGAIAVQGATESRGMNAAAAEGKGKLLNVIA